MAQVLDYSGPPPSAAAIKAAGYIGRVRYLAWLPNSKVMTPAEAQDGWGNGLFQAPVWEQGPSPLSDDPVKVGQEVDRQMRLDGWPDGWGFYIAMDEDAPQSLWPPYAGWGDACARAAQRPWRGYCMSALGEQLVADGHFPSFWDPYAWSGTGRPTPHACLFQRLGQITLDGTTCDVNDVLSLDWLGWNPSMGPSPGPSLTLPAINPPISLDAPLVDTQLTSAFPFGQRLLCQDGAVYCLGSASFFGGANGKSYFGNRTAARFDYPNPAEAAAGRQYVIVATTGERYAFPE